MDRAEFQRYIDNALQEAERVRTYCTQDEIVLIMTADFYRELLATADIHANRDGDHYGVLYGYRIALINEPTERTMVSPAVLGMTYHHTWRWTTSLLSMKRTGYSGLPVVTLYSFRIPV